MWTVDNWYEEARSAAAAEASLTQRRAEHLLSTYQQQLPDLSRQEIGSLLQDSNDARLAAVPDFAVYPELRGMPELIAAGWRGTRDGAGLDAAQWAANCDGLHYFHRHLQSFSDPEHGCSYVFFPDSEVGPILANNLDSSPEEPFGPPTWIPTNEHLILGGVSSGVFLDETSPETFPAPVFKLVGRYCRNVAEAVELLTRYGLFWGPGNLIVIDRDRQLAMIEKSRCRIGVRYSEDGFGFITAMTAADPAMREYLAGRRAASLTARGLPADCADTAYWRGADQRHQLMSELVDEARAKPSVETLRRIIQCRDPERGLVCYNGEILFPGGPPCEHTLRTTIWELRTGKVHWWAKDGDRPSFENPMPDLQYDKVWLWD